MAAVHNMLKDIASILDPGYDGEVLASRLGRDDFDPVPIVIGSYRWELLVQVGSSHLVLPAIYCNLKEKGMLKFLPEDLVKYLKEITSINRNRNSTIVEEVKEISSLFKDNDIEHVFLKGTAMLVSGYFKDIGERMVGDIDILVHPEQLIKAQNLFVRDGYKETELKFRSKFIEHRHLARLIPETKLAAVEIHRKLLIKPVKGQLQSAAVLNEKQTVNGISIPSTKDLLIHTVLNFEINDYGYYFNYLGLRNTYDALILQDKLNGEALKSLGKNKYVASFFEKASIYFIVPQSILPKQLIQFRKNMFLLKHKNKTIAKLAYGVLWNGQFLNIMIKRFLLFIRKKEYREYNLRDRKRILKLIKYRITNFKN